MKGHVYSLCGIVEVFKQKKKTERHHHVWRGRHIDHIDEAKPAKWLPLSTKSSQKLKKIKKASKGHF